MEGEDGGSNSTKAPRLPRWTRQEILVLIQGKKLAESRVRRGRTAALTYGSVVEPKWSTVSSYCKRHGVNRGPVQCRKRWSNLAADFKKIKEWESHHLNHNVSDSESDSFWVMRNDVRRDRKLPGFFDKEVYDILNGDGDRDRDGDGDGPAPPLLTQPILSLSPAEEEEEGEAVFDSGRTAAAEDGLFSDIEANEKEAPSKSPTLTTTTTNIPSASIPAPTPISVASEKQPAVDPEGVSTSQQGQKRRRDFSQGGDDGAEVEARDEGGSLTMQDQLVQVLEKNGRILCAQLEAQNINLKLDREERKDHAAGLVAVLNKLADALAKIADKL